MRSVNRTRRHCMQELEAKMQILQETVNTHDREPTSRLDNRIDDIERTLRRQRSRNSDLQGNIDMFTDAIAVIDSQFEGIERTSRHHNQQRDQEIQELQGRIRELQTRVDTANMQSRPNNPLSRRPTQSVTLSESPTSPSSGRSVASVASSEATGRRPTPTSGDSWLTTPLSPNSRRTRHPSCVPATNRFVSRGRRPQSLSGMVRLSSPLPYDAPPRSSLFLTPLETENLEHEPVPRGRRFSTGHRSSDREPRPWRQPAKRTPTGRVRKLDKPGSRTVWKNNVLVAAGAVALFLAAGGYRAVGRSDSSNV
ncbi:hypothetical protein C7974DRAFT_75722 [Boeremia exigua]|uniref:uncharacterized protein n=1 Tax=Boeremia exigua TaxID=749465 RepID=UPI001E8E18E5|nr:uncharacterized protein C7974DRAFT_75722 [Boeremia exigua]KAH6613116.1 hypothetical protein C7974DRAFT_75722 [Boeremia exigua]